MSSSNNKKFGGRYSPWYVECINCSVSINGVDKSGIRNSFSISVHSTKDVNDDIPFRYIHSDNFRNRFSRDQSFSFKTKNIYNKQSTAKVNDIYNTDIQDKR